LDEFHSLGVECEGWLLDRYEEVRGLVRVVLTRRNKGEIIGMLQRFN
jgi:hypothetical protein